MHLYSRHKSLPTWAALALTSAGIGLMLWAWTSDAEWLERVRAHVGILGFGLAGGIPTQWAVRGRWFELDDSALHMYRGGTLKRSWPLADLVRVQPFLGIYFVVFAEGSRVWIDHTAPGGLGMLNALRDRVRRRVVPNSGGDLHERWLPIAH